MSRLGERIMKELLEAMGPHEDAGPVSLRIRAWLMRHLPGQITCSEFERFVHDYQEGSLSARERRVFEHHMELCPMCRVHFDAYLLTIELGRRICVATDEQADLPAELAAAILDARRVH